MAALAKRTSNWAKYRAERVIYRVAGLPLAVRALLFGATLGPATSIRAAHAARYWHIDGVADATDIALGALISPFGLLIAAGWFVSRNGAIIARRSGKSPLRQLKEQLAAYFGAGILPPWYYIFELHEAGRSGRDYLNRFETKGGIYPLLRDRFAYRSPLNDKLEFTRHCAEHQIPTIPVIAVARNGEIHWRDAGELPDADLFVKRVTGRGGTDAERWDNTGGGRYRSVGAPPRELTAAQLLDHLRGMSLSQPQLVQPRLVNCAELTDINNGALSTVRIVTCLDEQNQPESVAAVLRMAIGSNHSVDNAHAGGMVAEVALDNGGLGPASDLGMDARLGWVDRHPDSGGQIQGRIVPRWDEMKRLAERAHRAFGERIVIGWDIAPTPDGPIIVEGNSGPDFDLMQRAARRGFASSRLADLLAYHLARVA
jgi:hypothetical protein